MALPDRPLFLAHIPEDYISSEAMIPFGEEKFPKLTFLLGEVGCSKRLAKLVQRLHTPAQMDNFIRAEIKHYNYGEDLSAEEISEQLIANCSDMNYFIAFVGNLNGYEGATVNVVADHTDPHHKFYVYRDRKTKLLGALSMSKHEELLGKPPQFKTIRELVESYYEVYTSDDELNHKGRLTMLGFTRPINLACRFGYQYFLTKEGIKEMDEVYWKGLGYAYRVGQRKDDLPEILTVPPDGGDIVVNGVRI